jgi:hypothetical protein
MSALDPPEGGRRVAEQVATPQQNLVAAALTQTGPVDPTSWESLAAVSPGLLGLERDIRRTADRIKSMRAGSSRRGKRAPRIDLVWAGRHGFKRRLVALVGWYAADPRLRSSVAYEAAYFRLYAILEDAYGGGR